MKQTEQTSTDVLLYREAEGKINRETAKSLVVLAIILLFGVFLNEVGVFDVDKLVMRIGAVCGAACYAAPAVILARPLCLFCFHGGEIVFKRWHKHLILAFAWLGTVAACITLTHHTVIVMAVPIMIMSQYRDTKRLVPITVLFGTICVFLGVYGGYFWGCFDGNLLHLASTGESVADLTLRRQIATPQRMWELFIHYALARELVVLALTLLAAKISGRTDKMLRRQAELQLRVEQEMRRKSEMQWQIIDGMANLIENRDLSTGEHVKRTSFYVKSIVSRLQTDSDYAPLLRGNAAETIVRAAPLHDIGKIVVADRILQKPGKLTDEEYGEIKLHAAEGVRVIENVLGGVEDADFLLAAKQIAGGHHERWDGKGYPGGLGGAQIPLAARIMAVADVFDALVSRRVYKKPIPPEEAFGIIESEAGGQFDPQVVRAFCDLRPQILRFLSGSQERT